MKFIFYVSKKKANRKGLSPIYGRITIDGERAEFSTGYFINHNEWKNEALKETDTNNVLINANLAKIRHDVNQIYYNMLLKHKSIRIKAERLKTAYLRGSGSVMCLVDLLDDFVQHKGKQVTKYSSFISYKLRYNILLDYLKETNLNGIMPEEFTEQKAHLFMDWLRHERKYTNNYSVKVIMFLKSALIHACRIEQLDRSPLQYFFVKNDKPKPIISLDEIELCKLMKHQFASERLQHVADLYIFQSYTGFCYTDLYDFDYNLHTRVVSGNEWIFKRRIKVDCEAVLPLFKEAKCILIKYGYKLPQITNQRYNAYLKEVADIIGIKKLLTTHTARKTFAMLKLDQGFSIESVAKMLGHASTKVTQSTYATVGCSRIESEMVRLRIA